MRVTQGMMTSTLLRNLSRNAGRLEELQEQISSARRINRPSQDPVGATVVLRLDSIIAQTNQFLRNIDDASDWLEVTDQVLDSIGQSVIRARELTVAAANGARSQADLAAIATELDALIGQVSSAGNVSYAGRYIFAGQHYTSPPFDVTATPPSYLGDSGAIVRTVDVGVQITINVTGDRAVEPVLSAMVEVRAAIVAGEQSGLQSALQSLDTAHERLLAAQADTGATMNRLEVLGARMEDYLLSVTKQRSNEQDVDVARAITDYSSQELVYTAALQIGARAIQPTLIDYLG